jgi:hypothetical protein
MSSGFRVHRHTLSVSLFRSTFCFFVNFFRPRIHSFDYPLVGFTHADDDENDRTFIVELFDVYTLFCQTL